MESILSLTIRGVGVWDLKILKKSFFIHVLKITIFFINIFSLIILIMLLVYQLINFHVLYQIYLLMMTRRRFQELFAGKLLLDIPSVPDHVIWKEGEERGDKLGCGRSIGSQNRLKMSTLSCRLQEENCENCIGFCFSGCSLREKKKITYDTERLIRLLC